MKVTVSETEDSDRDVLVSFEEGRMVEVGSRVAVSVGRLVAGASVVVNGTSAAAADTASEAAERIGSLATVGSAVKLRVAGSTISVAGAGSWV
jgi:hypothetical protein